MKKTCIFFRKLRLTYPILIGVAVAQLFKDFDLVLFALAFTFIGCFFDILTDTIWTAERVENIRKGRIRK